MKEEKQKNPGELVFLFIFSGLFIYFIMGQLISYGFFMVSALGLYSYFSSGRYLRSFYFKDPYIYIVLGLILTLMLGSIIYSIDMHLTMEGWRRIVVILALLIPMNYVIYQFETPNFPLKFVNFGLVIIFAYSIFEHSTEYYLHARLREMTGISGEISQPLDKATTLLTLLLPLIFFEIKRKNLQFLVIAFIGVLSYLIHPMFSASLAFFISMIFMGMHRYLGDIILKIVFLGSAVLLLITPVFFHYFLNVVHSKGIYENIQISWQMRVDMWGKMLAFIEKAPYFGHGFNVSQVIDKIDVNNETIIQMHPHNGFLQIWGELGIVGAVLFTGLIFAIYRLIMQFATAKAKTVYLGVYSSAMVFIMFSFSMWSTWWLSSIAMTLIVCFIYLPRLPKEAIK